jgi:hypothetical protein
MIKPFRQNVKGDGQSHRERPMGSGASDKHFSRDSELEKVKRVPGWQSG